MFVVLISLIGMDSVPECMNGSFMDLLMMVQDPNAYVTSRFNFTKLII